MRDLDAARAALDELRMSMRLADGGKPHALYRAIQRLRGTLGGAERELADRVLAERRLFVEPLRSDPWLMTFNGFGAKIYGKNDVDKDDGSYIATQFVTVLFVPVIPIRQLLVADASGGGWHIGGAVPLGPVARAWRWISAAILAASVALGLWSAADARGHSDVHFINALAVPAQIVVGAERFEVIALGRHELRLEAKPYPITVTLGGKVVDQGTIDVPGGFDAVIYNVLGAAPLYFEEIIYSAGGAGNETPSSSLLAGEKFYVRNAVDYVLVPPPETISVSKSSKSTRRRRVDLAPGGWRTSIAMLMSENQVDRAAALAAELAVLPEPDESIAMIAAQIYTLTGDFDAIFKLGDRLVEARPDEYWSHRMRVDAGLELGLRTELLAEYEAKLAAAPEATRPTYAALVARMEPPHAALARLGPLAPTGPDFVIGALAMAHHRLRQEKDAVALFERLFASESPRAENYLDEYVEDLVRAGKADVAFKLASERAASGSVEDARRFELVAARVGQAAPEAREKITEDRPAADAILDTRLGRTTTEQLAALEDRELAATLDIELKLRTDPDSALAALDGAPAAARMNLGRGAVALAFAELVRRGDSERARLLAKQAAIPGRWVDDATAFLERGERGHNLALLGLEMESALCFVRARKVGGKEAKSLMDEAKALDTFRQLVTSACERWPAPSDG